MDRRNTLLEPFRGSSEAPRNWPLDPQVFGASLDASGSLNVRRKRQSVRKGEWRLRRRTENAARGLAGLTASRTDMLARITQFVDDSTLKTI